MNATLINDPFAAAMNPQQPSSTLFGKMTVNAWFCSLIKGQGKVAYTEGALDPNTGKPARRNTAIDLTLDAFTDRDEPLVIERTVIAEFGEWPDVVLPSLKAIGLSNLQSLNQAWVQAELVPTGRVYTNSNGETKQATTLSFIAVYDNEAACKAAWLGEKGEQPAAAPTNGGQPVENSERATMLKFALVYCKNAVQKAGGDPIKAREILEPMLAGHAVMAKHFTVDSPEIVEALTVPF